MADFIAAGPTPEEVANYRASQQAQDRLEDLIERERQGCLTADETAELNHFVEVEHILRIAKAKARQILSASK